MLRQILSAFASLWQKGKRQKPNERKMKPDLKTLIITAGCPEDLAEGWLERVSSACAVYTISYGPRLAARIGFLQAHSRELELQRAVFTESLWPLFPHG